MPDQQLSPVSFALLPRTFHGERITIMSRRLEVPISNQFDLTSHQDYVLLNLSLAVSSATLPIAIITLYFFARMRRSFHHYLILLLITGEAFKQLWYFLFAVVFYATGPVKTSDAFCTAGGFILFESTEATDVAILLIALHNGLYVFYPPRSSREGGLHSYRWLCLAAWLIIPLILASIPFVQDGNAAYISYDTFCSLPRSPGWYRLALSWIPRYVVIAVTLAIYTSIYIYVHLKFQESHSRSHEVSRSSKQTARGEVNLANIDKRPEQAPRSAHTSLSTRLSSGRHPTRPRRDTNVFDARPAWEDVDFITSATVSLAASCDGPQDSTKIPSEAPPQPPPISERSQPDRTSWISDTFHYMLHPYRTTTTHSGTSVLSARPRENKQSHIETSTDSLSATRARIQRQLRYLFIYPVVYMLMWIPAFVANCMQLNGWFETHSSFPLSVIVVITISLQGILNCIIFCWRERPWNLVDGPEVRFVLRVWRKIKGTIWRGKVKGVGPEGEKTGGARAAYWWEGEARLRGDSV